MIPDSIASKSMHFKSGKFDDLIRLARIGEFLLAIPRGLTRFQKLSMIEYVDCSNRTAQDPMALSILKREGIVNEAAR
jgi:hypothetical protein